MIGIIPAGGKAERMGGLPKMLLPIPDGTLFERLCAQMRCGGAEGLLVDASSVTLPFLTPLCNYDTALYVAGLPTMSASVLDARQRAWYGDPFLFGMPDTWFEDNAAFLKLVKSLDRGADVAVGVFRARPGQHREGGMVRVRSNQVVEVVDKPDETTMKYIWGVLAWQPSFWQHMDAADPHIGYALPRAIAAGLNVRAVLMDGGFWDAGTPDRYFALIRHLTTEEVPA